MDNSSLHHLLRLDNHPQNNWGFPRIFTENILSEYVLPVLAKKSPLVEEQSVSLPAHHHYLAFTTALSP